MKKKSPSFYMKILLAIILCFILPLSALFLYGYARMERTIAQKVEQLTENELQKMDMNVQDMIGRLNRTASYMSTDHRLNDLMRSYVSQIPENTDFSLSKTCPDYLLAYDYLMLATEIQTILQNYTVNWLDASSQAGLILEDGRVFSTWSSYNTDFSLLMETIRLGYEDGVDEYFSEAHPSFILYSESSSCFTYVKRLYDIQSPKVSLGILVVTTPVSVIRNIVHQYPSGDTSVLYLFDQSRNTILAENTDDISPEEMLALYRQQPDSRKVTTPSGKALYFNCMEIPETGWLFCYAVSHELVFAEILQLRRAVIAAFVLLLILISLVLFLIIYRLLRPIRVLQKGMQAVEEGGWELPPLPCSSHDEVGMITVGFNRLMEELRSLISQIQESEKQKGELRFEMLLAQINPHFLFNTLNSIKWMATMIHADNITNTIRSLARLLEISMNKQADVLSIHEELLNLQSYLEIQAVRYSDLFHVEYAIDPDLEQYETLKLVFQPIVENAVIHNILEVPALRIAIQGKLENGDVVFTITDNGKGMDAQQIQQLLSGKLRNDRSVFRGIGITNVQQRIQIKYGSQYGIAIQSEPGRGTCVTIRFPAVPFQPPQQTKLEHGVDQHVESPHCRR